MKTPTSVLTELGDYRRHKFLKFGIEAEQDYARMLSTPQRDEVCLFNRFKMKLHTDVSELVTFDFQNIIY